VRCVSAGADRPECGICADPAYVVTGKKQNKNKKKRADSHMGQKCILKRGWTGPGDRWEIGPFVHMCASVVGVSVGPSVVGRDWSPVSSNKARGYCCRTPGDHWAPLQPRRAARRDLRVCRYSAS
jgi:hypothetical protein